MHRNDLLAANTAQRPAAKVLGTGETYDMPLAEHGFSMLVTVSRAGHDHHVLFDAGMTSNGLSDNMRRMGLSPFDIFAPAGIEGWFEELATIVGSKPPDIEAILASASRHGTELDLESLPALLERHAFHLPGL